MSRWITLLLCLIMFSAPLAGCLDETTDDGSNSEDENSTEDENTPGQGNTPNVNESDDTDGQGTVIDDENTDDDTDDDTDHKKDSYTAASAAPGCCTVEHAVG